ncbi:universal stress protein [Maribacter halichondriae]|uniref:universal stress protein n=1 Tax=Maribacter halichondriae TaxID=2980554 RepID=UPI0023599AEB|nr:universal stress protein [Maribacter sp. Hal144]
MKNILVATDFSNDAYCALFYISKLMASRPCAIYILNVFDENTPLHGKKTKLFGSKKRLKEIATESKEKLTSTYHKIIMDTENPQHRFQTISKKGILVKVLAKTIDDHQIDLVVMGTKGNTGAKEIFLGSNTVQAANTLTKCPILAVPKQIDYKAPKEIAFVTDFKKGCAKETIAPLLYLASFSDASIRVMHINEEKILNKEQESHRKLLELCLKNVDHSFHWMQNFTDKAQVIDTFLEKLDIDMFAMAHHKRSFFEKLVREPVIKDVSIYSDIPFLILPHQD